MSPLERILSKLPSARATAAGYQASCPAHDDRNPSLSLRQTDDGKVLLKCHAGCPPEAVVAAVGMHLRDLFPAPICLPDLRGSERPSRPAAPGSASVTRLLQECRADAAPIGAYLRARGLSGAVPPALRLHPALPYYEDKTLIGRFPAMVGVIQDSAGATIGVHRTYLAHEANAKAAVGQPKKALGKLAGGAIRLREPSTGTLALAEGIETALAVMEATGTATWSTVGAENLKGVGVPAGVTIVEFWADHDANEVGQKAAEKAAAALHALGHAVFVLIPPEPGDWLDVFVAQGPEALRTARARAQPWVPPGPPVSGAAADTKLPPSWEPPVPFRTYRLPAFPLDTLLPTWLRERVAAEAEATQTPTDLAAMIGLAIVALTVAGKVTVRVAPDWLEPVNIFTAVVLPPGTRKSAVMAHMTAPLERWEAKRHAEAVPRIAEFEARREIAEKVLQRAVKEAADASPDKQPASQLRAEALARELAEMRGPVAPRLLADDVSPEKLASLLCDHGGRMAVVSPEGDLFDLMSGRYSKNSTPNFGVLLKGHAGDPLRVDRVGRDSEFVPHPAVTLGLAVQPDVVAGLVSRPGFKGRGLLGRFLYSWPPNLLGTRRITPPAVPLGVRATYDAKIEALLALPEQHDDRGQLLARELTLSPDARHRLAAFQERVEKRLGESGDLGHMTDWAGKLVGAVVRIAGILHVALHVPDAPLAGDGSNVHVAQPETNSTDTATPTPPPWDHSIWSRAVAGSTIEAPIRLAEYLVEHAKAAYGRMGADPAVEDAEHVVRWMKRSDSIAFKQQVFSKRDAFQGNRGRFKRVRDLDPPLEVLREHGIIRLRDAEGRSGPGRKPSPLFEVNPLIFEVDDSEQTENSEHRRDHDDAGGPEFSNSEDTENSEHHGAAEAGAVPPASATDEPGSTGSQNSHNAQNPTSRPEKDGSDDDDGDEETVWSR